MQTLTCQLSSTLMQLLFWFDQDMTVEKTFIQTLSCQLSSTFMQQNLLSFDQDTTVEKNQTYNSHDAFLVPINQLSNIYSYMFALSIQTDIQQQVRQQLQQQTEHQIPKSCLNFNTPTFARKSK